MEPLPAARYAAYGSNFLSVDAPDDPEVVEVSPSSWSFSKPRKRRRNPVVIPHDILAIDGDDNCDPGKVITGEASDVLVSSEGPGMVIIGQTAMNKKNKQPMNYVEDIQEQVKKNLYGDLAGSSTYLGLKNITLPALQKNLYGDLAGSSTYLGLKNITLPALQNSFTWEYSHTNNFPHDKNEVVDFVTYGYEGVFDSYYTSIDMLGDLNPPSGLVINVPLSNEHQPEEANRNLVVDSETDLKFKAFKQFDIIQDYSDHHYVQETSTKGVRIAKKPPKNWARRIQNEWKILEKDLPDSIYVRVYEERMDLLRAVIIGPVGTPYHDGLFFFDVLFPSNYPNAPPLVYYHSGGLRLNPNLYNNGKVCLSLLGTWSGKGCEKWSPAKSTMLQVLVSIQALVLNAKPFFNEPGYENLAGTVLGEQKALAYSENAFLLSCKTMLYTLRKPPKNFEDFVAGHFRQRGNSILVTCRAYMNGAQVGCVDKKGVQDVDEGDKSCSATFRAQLQKLYEELFMKFTATGAECSGVRTRKVEAKVANYPNPTLNFS